MIFVSSTCLKNKSIKESIEGLAIAGFKNIELSGGSNYYSDLEKDLLILQDKYDLTYRLHNYFPPPKKHFMLNLSSSYDEVRKNSIELCVNAIKLSKKINAKKYGVHAGFLIDFLPKEAGKKIAKRTLIDKEKAFQNFSRSWLEIKEEAGSSISLYIENNVFSSTNLKTYAPYNPFLLTCSKDYEELSEYIDFNLLLDVGHLKVSSKSLGLNFIDELNFMFPLTDYVHLSNNDGLHDQNHNLHYENSLVDLLSKQNLKNKTFTLETYCEIDEIRHDYNFIKKTMDKK